MDRDPEINGGARTKPKRLARDAVRSSLRRYPSQLISALRNSGTDPDHEPRPVLDELLPHDLAVSWLGHASVLLGLGDQRMVVDPVLSRRIGPRVRTRTIGIERLEPAPFGPDSLRGVDAILITHAHFDHLDRETLMGMTDERTTVIVPKRCGRLVPRGFGRVVELDEGGVFELQDTEIRAHAPRHWGARAWLDRSRGFSAYELRHGVGNVFFAGDTAYTDAFDGLEDIDLAVFGIGAYNPWEHMHATPEQVWRMFNAIGASRLLPVHHSTFELSDEPKDEPMERLIQVAGPGIGRVVTPGVGRLVQIETGR